MVVSTVYASLLVVNWFYWSHDGFASVATIMAGTLVHSQNRLCCSPLQLYLYSILLGSMMQEGDRSAHGTSFAAYILLHSIQMKYCSLIDMHFYFYLMLIKLIGLINFA